MSATLRNDAIVLSDSEDDIAVDAADSDHTITFEDTPQPNELDNDDDEDSDDEDDGLEVVNGQEWHTLQARKAAVQQLLGLLPGQEVIESVTVLDAHTLRPGMNIELSNGDFFRVKYLTKDKRSGEVTMHGWSLVRANRMNNQVKKMRGEVVLTIFAAEDDKRPDLEKGLEQRSLNDINPCSEKFGRTIIFTNRAAPWHRDDPWSFRSSEEHWARGRLVCRIKNIKSWTANTGTQAGVKITGEGWIWFTEHEADAGYGVSDISHTIAWRQGRDKPRKKRSRESKYSESVVSDKQTKRLRRNNRGEVTEVEMLEHYEVRTTSRRVRRSEKPPIIFKAADLCCGAGGVSAGMEEAGFQIGLGVDSWKVAAETFRQNWPNAKTYEQDVRDFVINGTADKCTYCHVVHFSLPCQRFSGMNTNIVNNERDEENLATHLVVEEALKSLRPMYATFENTSGLKEIMKHRDYLNTLIKSLTDLGWNDVFKVEKLSKYGNPQRRKRLIVIASCPGMKLVDFPPPTHGEERHLLPLQTVDDVIHGIDPADPLHNRYEQKQRQRQQPTTALEPADLHAPLRHLITCAGPRALHPNGKRRFTFREGMRLMRFRDEHRLVATSATDKWKLIGNAVPRDIIRLIYTDIHKVLKTWFEEAEAPVEILDSDEDVSRTVYSSSTLSSPTPARDAGPKARPSGRRSKTKIEVSDSEADEGLEQALAASRISCQSPMNVQPSIESVFRPRKRATRQQAEVKKETKPFGDVDVLDLTHD